MHSQVTDEVALLGKLASAKLAFVGLLPRVDAHVLCQTVLAGEAHAALFTCEWLKAEMAAHVTRHGSPLGEHFAADVAGERPGQPVALFMLSQRRWILVALTADCAFEGTRLRGKVGGTHRGRQVLGFLLILFLHKSSPLFFDVELVLGMRLHMSVELLGTGETFTTWNAHVEVVSECWFKPLLAVHVVGAMSPSSSSSISITSTTCTLSITLPALISVVLSVLSILFIFTLIGGKVAAAPPFYSGGAAIFGAHNHSVNQGSVVIFRL